MSRGGMARQAKSAAGKSNRSVASGRVGNKDVGDEGMSRGGTSPMDLWKTIKKKKRDAN